MNLNTATNFFPTISEPAGGWLMRLIDRLSGTEPALLRAWQQTLLHGQLQRFDRPLGLKLRCISGCLWLTVDGDLLDRVLEAGESFEPTDRRPVIAYAIEDAVMRVEPVAGRTLQKLNAARSVAMCPRLR